MSFPTFLGFDEPMEGIWCSFNAAEKPPIGYYHWKRRKNLLIITRISDHRCPYRNPDAGDVGEGEVTGDASVYERYAGRAMRLSGTRVCRVVLLGEEVASFADAPSHLQEEVTARGMI